MQRATPLPGAQVLFVTIDPERDSAATCKSTSAPSARASSVLRGDSRGPGAAAEEPGAIAVRENLPGGSYTMDHSATLYLLDTRGRLVAVFSPPFSAPKLTADLRRVAAARSVIEPDDERCS